MSEDQTKFCSKCQNTKSLEEFYVRKTGKRAGIIDGPCKECCIRCSQNYKAANPEKVRLEKIKWVADNPDRVRLIRVKHKYGLSKEQYEALPKECAICGSTTDLHIDHNHTTGIVRDILCGFCNRGIGMFKDNPNNLIRATDYILKHFDEGPL